MAGFLDRLGRACARVHGLVIVVWLAAAVGLPRGLDRILPKIEIE